MNILVISHNQKGWTYETLHNEHLSLKKFGKNKYYFWGPGYDFETNDAEKIVQKYLSKNIKFDLIYINQSQQDLIGKYNYSILPKNFYKKKFEYFPINLHKIRIPKILLVGDFWIINKYAWEYIFKKYDVDFAFSIVLNHYSSNQINDKFQTAYVKKKIKFFEYLRTIPEYKELKKLNKKYDFVSFGAKEKKFYPNRLFFENVLKDVYKNNKKKILAPDHPGYQYNNKKKNIFFGRKYLKALSQSKCMITDTTDLKIPLIKHLECMYYGCVMICDRMEKPQKYKLKKNFNFIEVDRDNVRETIFKVINNQKIIDRIKRNAYLTYRKHFSNKKFVKRIELNFNKVSKFRKKKMYHLTKTEILYLKSMIFTLDLIKIVKKIINKIFNLKKFIY